MFYSGHGGLGKLSPEEVKSQIMRMRGVVESRRSGSGSRVSKSGEVTVAEAARLAAVKVFKVQGEGTFFEPTWTSTLSTVHKKIEKDIPKVEMAVKDAGEAGIVKDTSGNKFFVRNPDRGKVVSYSEQLLQTPTAKTVKQQYGYNYETAVLMGAGWEPLSMETLNEFDGMPQSKRQMVLDMYLAKGPEFIEAWNAVLVLKNVRMGSTSLF